MGFTRNSDGTKTWTNSSGTYSYTSTNNGRITNRTTSWGNGRHSTSVNYSDRGSVSSVTRTHNGSSRTTRGW